jgi:hypothetical protein
MLTPLTNMVIGAISFADSAIEVTHENHLTE